MSSSSKTLGFCALMAIASSVLTVLAFEALLEPKEPAGERVTFEAFLSDLESGKVEAITIDGRTYRYRQLVESERRLVEKEAEGPEPTLASIRRLHPSSPDRPPPRIRFVE